MKNRIRKYYQQNKSFILFLGLMFVFRSAVADWNEVPTASMKPTIIEGDRILVNKMAYDIRLPFTHISLVKIADPARGDIIVFDSEVSDKRLVKRVIGMPGDRVELKHNTLYINENKLTYRDISSTDTTRVRIEDLLGTKHFIRISKQGSSLSSFAATFVPVGHYLVLGDNRDNSADSRVIGFVPRKEIVGRSKKVVMSLDYERFYIPRSDRFLHDI